MKSVEFLKPGTKSTSRVFLFAFALSVAAAFGPKTVEAAPGDGISVCSVFGSNDPGILNPDPLNYCLPGIGRMDRLGSGTATNEYMERFYPNGVAKDGIFPTAERITRGYMSR